MKKISLILLLVAGTVWVSQTASAQVIDSSKNKVEIRKKVKVGANGRKVTTIKMEGTGTPSAITGAADGAVTGKLPTPAPVVVTPPPAPVATPPEPVAPTVIMVTTPAPPEAKHEAPSTTVVTTTTETAPVPAANATMVHKTNTSAHVVHHKGVYHKTYVKKATVAPATKTTTTTTTVKKSE